MDALIVIFATGLISLFIALAKKPVLVLLTAVIGLVVAGALMANQLNNPSSIVPVSYQGLDFTSNETIMFSLLAIGFVLLVIIGGFDYFKKESEHTGEYIGLLLFSLVGALCMLSFTDLFMFFIGLEILSIPMYVMAGSKKYNAASVEASVKYFFTGSFATGILLFGIAWIFGATGSFKLADIQLAIQEGTAAGALLNIGILMIMASFLFKVSAAPFHFWSPDVYGGSPNIVTGFMASVVKLSGLFAFMRLFTITFGQAYSLWSGALLGLIVLTMFVGNLSALRQTKFKRLLAYSSISNAGYALIALLTQSMDVNRMYWNLWVYLLGYGLAIIILIVVSVALDNENDDIEAFRGIGRKNPLLGVVFSIGLLSLAGVPPLAGFTGKYVVFSSAFDQYPVLVLIALLNSGIGVYYYIKLLMVALSADTEGTKKVKPSVLQWFVLLSCSVLLLVCGIALLG